MEIKSHLNDKPIRFAEIHPVLSGYGRIRPHTLKQKVACADSISVWGVKNPPLLFEMKAGNPSGKPYLLVAGTKRISAEREILGWSEVPTGYARIYETANISSNEVMLLYGILAFDSNTDTDEISAVEQAFLLRKLEKDGHSQIELAKLRGVTPQAISRVLVKLNAALEVIPEDMVRHPMFKEMSFLETFVEAYQKNVDQALIGFNHYSEFFEEDSDDDEEEESQEQSSKRKKIFERKQSSMRTVFARMVNGVEQPDGTRKYPTFYESLGYEPTEAEINARKARRAEERRVLEEYWRNKYRRQDEELRKVNEPPNFASPLSVNPSLDNEVKPPPIKPHDVYGKEIPKSIPASSPTPSPQTLPKPEPSNNENGREVELETLNAFTKSVQLHQAQQTASSEQIYAWSHVLDRFAKQLGVK